MAHIDTKNGQVDWDSTEVDGADTWSLSYTAEAVDTTDYADAGVSTFLGNCKSSWSGSFTAFKDGALPIAQGAIATIKLYESQTANQFWTGTAIITEISSESSSPGVIKYNYSFQGTGALTAPAA